MSILDGKEKLGAGRLVENSFYELIKKKQIPEEVLKMWQDRNYSNQLLGINYPLLVKIQGSESEIFNKTNISGGSRYWKRIATINSEKYKVCNHWYNNDTRNNIVKYIKWFVETEKKLVDK
jgi:hypothetical protein